MKRVGPRKVAARVAGLFRAGTEDFQTRAVEALELSFDGIADDVHRGATRLSSGREPWYRRGTEIRNERQVSLLCPGELAAVATNLSLPEVKAEWIGGNMLIEGIPAFSWLPPRTLLFFEGGVTLKVDGDNNPCRLAGRKIAAQYEGRGDVELGFAKAARHRRGLVAWVEKPGRIAAGETLKAWVPEQWIYR